MKNAKELHQLINTLSKSEKRNFKLYSQRYPNIKDSSYIKLFETLEKMEIYEGDAIKKLFPTEKKIKQLNPTIAYLFTTIMKSLNEYSDTSSIPTQLKQMVSSASILREKGLIDKSRKILIKAKKIAVDSENFTTLLDIYAIFSSLSSKDSLEIMNEKIVTLKKIENKFAYEKIHNKISLYFGNKEAAREEEELKKIAQILAEPLLKNEEQALSITAKQSFHQIKGACYYYSGNFEKSLEHLLKKRAYLEYSPDILKMNLSNYLSTTNNILVVCFSLRRHEDLNNIIEDLYLKLNNNKYLFSPRNRAKIFRLYVTAKLNFMKSTGLFEEAQNLLPRMAEDFDKYKNQLSIDELARIYSFVSSIYFGIGDYKNALLFANKVLRHKKTFHNIDNLIVFQLINIIIHYEMGHNELITSLERSFRRYLKNENRLLKTELILLRFFKTIINISSKKEKNLAFKKLKKELIKNFEDPIEAKLLGYFDFIAWTDSKIQNRPFAEVVKEKAQLKN